MFDKNTVDENVDIYKLIYLRYKTINLNTLSCSLKQESKVFENFIITLLCEKPPLSKIR